MGRVPSLCQIFLRLLSIFFRVEMVKASLEKGKTAGMPTNFVDNTDRGKKSFYKRRMVVT
jgi:hypothetical protein